MKNSWITRDTRVSDVIDVVPGAEELFTRHGADPVRACAQMTHALTLTEVGTRCGLRDVEGLIADLNAVLAQCICD